MCFFCITLFPDVSSRCFKYLYEKTERCSFSLINDATLGKFLFEESTILNDVGMKCCTCSPSVSPCCARYAPVKVGDELRVLLLQHVQKMVPLLLSP